MVWNCSFTPLQTYKVLKQICVGWEQPTVLHHYKLTRFSNWRDVDSWAIEFYTITNLQGSQTYKLDFLIFVLFYTITNLQGSQTSNEIITEPNISVNMRKPPSNV